MPNDKRFVYVLESRKDPARHYVGLTSDVTTRVDVHNAEFSSERSATLFEQYLKSGSGRAFAKRHFI